LGIRRRLYSECLKHEKLVENYTYFFESIKLLEINNPIIAPNSCANKNRGTEAGEIPVKVSLNVRVKVIEGLTKAVDEV
jgi:hypothetical protein